MSGARTATAAVAAMILLSGCGRKGPLLYPDMLVPAAPSSVVALQSGDAVRLQFVLPDKDRGGRSLQGLSGVNIARRAAEPVPSGGCRSCRTDYAHFATLYLDSLPATVQRSGGRMVLFDAGVTAGYAYTYSIVPFMTDRTEGVPALSAELPVSAPYPPPALGITMFPTEVRVTFNPPAGRADRLIGYNLYRRPQGGTASYLPYAGELPAGKEFTDTALERGVRYRYSARALVMTATGGIAESAESEAVEGMLTDNLE